MRFECESVKGGDEYDLSMKFEVFAQLIGELNTPSRSCKNPQGMA